MNIGGLLPFTMIDFPGKLSAVVFCQGCVLRCPYCHNPELQTVGAQTDVRWDDVLQLLRSRQKLLDGVVFSGGEPLVQDDLKKALEQVKELGFQTALHTSGALVDRLKEVLPLVDWIGLDVKAPFAHYAKASGTKSEAAIGSKTEQALDLILNAGIPFEARTTTDPRVLTKADVKALALTLSQKGVKHYALQEYRPLENGKLPEPSPTEITSFYTDKVFLDELKELFDDFIVRRA